jgi:hypothetical protein
MQTYFHIRIKDVTRSVWTKNKLKVFVFETTPLSKPKINSIMQRRCRHTDRTTVHKVTYPAKKKLSRFKAGFIARYLRNRCDREMQTITAGPRTASGTQMIRLAVTTFAAQRIESQIHNAP